MGSGSYLQTVSSEGDTHAILLGVITMIAVIVILDQLVWRPIIAWAQKFKFEQVEASNEPRSRLLDFLRRSRARSAFNRRITNPLAEQIGLHFARREGSRPTGQSSHQAKKWALRALGVLVILGVLLVVGDATRLLAGLTASDLRALVAGACATFLRVLCALLICCMDHSRGSLDRIQSPIGADRATTRPDCGLSSSDCAISNRPTLTHQNWRWARRRVDSIASARHTMVCALQCHRWRDGNSH